MASLVRWIFPPLLGESLILSKSIRRRKRRGSGGQESFLDCHTKSNLLCSYRSASIRTKRVNSQKDSMLPSFRKLYYQVQDVLDGRKRKSYKPKIYSADIMPLRGFLICPQCGELLTGMLNMLTVHFSNTSRSSYREKKC